MTFTKEQLQHIIETDHVQCGDALPVVSCPCDGDSACWVTRGWHETKLSV